MRNTLKKRICAFALFGLMLALVPAQGVLAAQTDSYVTGDDNYRQPVPESYVVTRTVNSVKGLENFGYTEKEITTKKFFKTPKDIFIDDEDNIYIVEEDGNRVIKMDNEGNALAVVTAPNNIALQKPQGIFVDSDGDMYIADRDNHRIVHTDGNGKFIEQFTIPDAKDLDIGEAFNPEKLVVNETGLIFVVQGEKIIKIDGTNTYRGSFGQTNIGFSLSEMLRRTFASERQQLFSAKRLASSYINVTLGNDGAIYATSFERVEGEIKKLNSVGTNIYRKYRTIGNSIGNPIRDFINNKILKAVVAGQSFRFGEYFDDNGMYIEPEFVDICVDNAGIVTIVELKGGKVYQYDQDGRMLVAFGGLGEKKGTFARPSAIDVDSKGNLYVLDQSANNFQIFSPTEFIQTVHQATSTYNEGRYQDSFELWKKVLATDENYSLAHVGIAKSYYKQGEYKLAMEESMIVSDRDTYTMAFDEYKYEVLRDNFLLIIVLIVVICVVVFLLVGAFLSHAKKSYWSFLTEKSKKMGIVQGIEYSFNIIFHPNDAIEGIKWNRNRINMITPFVLFFVAYAVRIAYLYVVHFPLASIEIQDVNPWFELVKLLIIPVSWIPASFMATSISGGESKVREILFTSAASLCPFIAINLPLMFLSKIMSKSQKGWYGVFSALAYIGMFLILFAAIKALNSYSFWKAVGMMFVSAFLMLVLWLVVLLCYVLTGRMIQFIISIIEEFKLNFLN